MKRSGRQNRPSQKLSALSERQERGAAAPDAPSSLKSTGASVAGTPGVGESPEQYSDSMFVLEMVSDGRLRIVEASPDIGKSLGVSRGAIVGTFIEDAVPGELAERLISVCGRCVETGVADECDFPVELPDGNRIFQLTLVPLLSSSRTPHRIAALLRDRATRQLNAVHRAAARILSNLVHGHDRQRLLETICRIAVEDECASYAWIGFSEGSAGIPKPVAWFGTVASGEPPFQAAGSHESDDPALIATRENRSVYDRNIASSSRNGTGRWRNHLLSLGYRSCLALPLSGGESTSGVIMLLSPELDSYSHQAIAALESLAVDISYLFATIEVEDASLNDATWLRQSNELFRQFTDSIRAVFWMVDTQDRSHIYVSAGYEEIWGRTRESVRANPDSWLDAVHPEDRERVGRAMHSEYADDREYRIVRPDGSIRWVRDRAFPVRNRFGDIVRIAGIAEDVTREKDSEELIRKESAREALLRDLYERGAAMTELELHDFVLERVLQLTESEFGFIWLIADDQQTVLHTAWCPSTLQSANQKVDNHYPLAQIGNFAESARLKHPVVYNDYPASPDPKGVIPGAMDVVRFLGVPAVDGDLCRIIIGVGNKKSDYDDHDVLHIQLAANELRKLIEKRHAEDALLSRERELREAQRLAKIGSWDWDAASGITTWSEEFFHLLGLDPEQDLPTDENRLRSYTPESARRLESAIRRSIDEGIPYELELELEQVRADGTRRWIAARSEIKRDRNGTLIGVRGTAQDITEQRDAETKIIRLASIVESSDDAIISNTLDGIITSWNRGAQEMYGYSEQEMTGKSISMLVPSDIDDDLPEILALIRGGKHIKHSETVRRRKDGRSVHVSLTVSPVFGPDGRVVGASTIARDVTDQYRAERALRILADINRALTHVESEKQLLDEACRIMVEVGGYGLAWVGYATSDEARSITPVAAAGSHVDYASGVHASWADNERGRGPAGTAVRSGKTVVFRDIATDPDFTLWRNFALECGYKSIISIPLFTEGIASGVLGIYSAEIDAFDAEETRILDEAAAQISYGISALRTSTLRSQAEAARQLLASAVDQAAEVIVITDAESVIQYVNPAFEVVTGFSRAEVIGRTPRLLSSGLHGIEFYTELWETITSGSTWSGQFVNRKKDGSHYYENATISPVRNTEGTIVNYVAVKHDITRERELEEQLRQAQKMESVGRLAGGVAHDFNNMLQIMNGYIELSMTELEPGTSLYANLQQVRNVAHKSADLTRQLLAFARKQTVSPKLIAVNEAVSAALSMLRRLIGEDIELTWKPAKDTGRIMFDQSQFDQILTNLVANARDAISGVGNVIIEADNVEIDRDYCSHHSGFVPGAYVMLAVSDSGSGMDSETLSHLFEPFFTTKNVGQGTGLGLATVYGIVQQNNGLINVYSEPEHGSTFRIYFQRSDLTPVVAAAAPAARGRPRGTETLLVVEDESGILEIARHLLEGLGYTVLAASTPEEAIQKAADFAGRIDLLITDVVMPQMNGRELSERLSTARPQMRCLFMSGYTADVIAHRGLLDAEIDFIPKPFSLAELARKVRDTLA